MLIWTFCRKIAANKNITVVMFLLFASPIILWRATRANAARRVLGSLCRRRRYHTFRTPADEDAYWTAAETHRRYLRCSDARFVGSKKQPPGISAVTSYVPALLPSYRQRVKKVSSNYGLSLRTICKWHRMVFAGPWHPTISEASRMRERFSVQDRQEIHRISRMLPDEMVFGAKAKKWSRKYRDMWRKWLASTDSEVSIFFE
ncbi:hypothetical protein C8F01DRAFT_1123402 [Mycena amicta]|nr:hypothetical protein C8F01DRAFT_1123402 [Mycena amicta]